MPICLAIPCLDNLYSMELEKSRISTFDMHPIASLSQQPDISYEVPIGQREDG